MTWFDFFLIYIAVINLFGGFLVVLDKRRAKQGGRRVRERTLFLFGALGGAVCMYLSMLFVRHKTRHISFMIGFPLMISAQMILVFLLATDTWRTVIGFFA